MTPVLPKTVLKPFLLLMLYLLLIIFVAIVFTGRHQVARRELRPREAHHLRGRRGTSPVRQTTIPKHQNPINKQTDKQTSFMKKALNFFVLSP